MIELFTDLTGAAVTLLGVAVLRRIRSRVGRWPAWASRRVALLALFVVTYVSAVAAFVVSVVHVVSAIATRLL